MRVDRPVPDGQSQGGGQASLVPANLILISHGHGDHVGDAVAIARRTGATVATTTKSASGSAGPATGLGGASSSTVSGFVFDQFVRVKLTLAPLGVARWQLWAAIPAALS